MIRLLILLCLFWALAGGHRHFPYGMVIFWIVVLALIPVLGYAARELLSPGSSRRRR